MSSTTMRVLDSGVSDCVGSLDMGPNPKGQQDARRLRTLPDKKLQRFAWMPGSSAQDSASYFPLVTTRLERGASVTLVTERPLVSFDYTPAPHPEDFQL